MSLLLVLIIVLHSSASEVKYAVIVSIYPIKSVLGGVLCWGFPFSEITSGRDHTQLEIHLKF